MLTPQEYLDCAKEENRQKIKNQIRLISDHVKKELSEYLDQRKNDINKNIYIQIEITKFVGAFGCDYRNFKSDIIESILEYLPDWYNYLKIDFEPFGNFDERVAVILCVSHDFNSNKFVMVR